MRRCFTWIKTEFFHILPVFVFFFLAFYFINLSDTVIMKMAGIPPFSDAELAIAAALIAKIFLVVDHVRCINLPAKIPLIIRILWKTVIYWLIGLSVRLVIRITPHLIAGGHFVENVEHFLDSMQWTLFFSIQSWTFMLFFIYITARELTTVIGIAQMRRIFFG